MKATGSQWNSMQSSEWVDSLYMNTVKSDFFPPSLLVVSVEAAINPRGKTFVLFRQQWKEPRFTTKGSKSDLLSLCRCSLKQFRYDAVRDVRLQLFVDIQLLLVSKASALFSVVLFITVLSFLVYFSFFFLMSLTFSLSLSSSLCIYLSLCPSIHRSVYFSPFPFSSILQWPWWCLTDCWSCSGAQSLLHPFWVFAL